MLLRGSSKFQSVCSSLAMARARKIVKLRMRILYHLPPNKDENIEFTIKGNTVIRRGSNQCLTFDSIVTGDKAHLFGELFGDKFITHLFQDRRNALFLSLEYIYSFLIQQYR